MPSIEAMTRLYKDSGNARVGDILAFIAAAVSKGDTAAIPASALPLLSVHARCRPVPCGENAGCFVFRPVDGEAVRCGKWERALAVLALVLACPIGSLIAVLIILFDGFPVLFRQERYGKGGAPFVLLKFRTMLRRAETLHEKLQNQKGASDRLFKLENDPRVTRFGNFLRRTFLDEWPQLVNVARGEMRFVGPRPLPESDQRHYRLPGHALRLEGLPGMTGLWQVSGRNARTFDEMCLLDYYYLCNRSAAMDVRIVWRTFCLLVKQIGLKREAQNGGQ